METVIINISGGGDVPLSSVEEQLLRIVMAQQVVYTDDGCAATVSSFFFPSLCVSIAHHREIILF